MVENKSTCNTDGFKPGDILVVTGASGVGERVKIKQVSANTLTLAPVRWYRKLWRLTRTAASVAYWWCKVQRKKLSVWRLERG